MSDSLSSLAKTVPTLRGTESFTNWRRANTAYLLEKGAHRVLKGRETELLRDVHYIPAAQSNILLAGGLQRDGWTIYLPERMMRKGRIKLDIIQKGVLPYVQIRITSPSAYPSTSSVRTEEKGRVDGDGYGIGDATITQIMHRPGGAATAFRGEIKLDGEQFKGSAEGAVTSSPIQLASRPSWQLPHHLGHSYLHSYLVYERLASPIQVLESQHLSAWHVFIDRNRIRKYQSPSRA